MNPREKVILEDLLSRGIERRIAGRMAANAFREGWLKSDVDRAVEEFFRRGRR